MSLDLGDLQIGALSDWVSGIATSIAVITALVFSLRQERRQDEERLHSVYVWPEQSDEDQSWSIVVTNKTQYPIYEWQVTIEWIPPGTNEKSVEHLSSKEQGILRPEDTPFDDWEAKSPLPASESEVRTSIDFTDALGRKMRRRHTGKLERG